MPEIWGSGGPGERGGMGSLRATGGTHSVASYCGAGRATAAGALPGPSLLPLSQRVSQGCRTPDRGLLSVKGSISRCTPFTMFFKER